MNWLDDAHTREKATRGRAFLQDVLFRRYNLSKLRRVFLSGGPNERGRTGQHERDKRRGGEWQLTIRYGSAVPTAIHTRQAPLYVGKADLYDRIDQVYADAASTLWRADRHNMALQTLNEHWHEPGRFHGVSRQARSVKGRLVAEWFDIEGTTVITNWDEACVWQGAWVLYGYLREEKLIEGRATGRYADTFADSTLAEFRKTLDT